MNKFNSGKYKEAYTEFSGMMEDSKGHYLAAYWAGVSAQKLKKNDESLEWIEKALSINPNYKPAAEFKVKTLKK
jgi:tetratricopeptide (TPR) repeat protein